MIFVDVPTDWAPLKKAGGRSDVSDPKRTFRLHPERRPPYGQTSTNQFLFEKAIFNDAFHDVVNDAVNDPIAILTPRNASVVDGG
jgi:hypothetical protein